MVNGLEEIVNSTFLSQMVPRVSGKLTLNTVAPRAPTLSQTLTLAFLKMLFGLFERWIPIHDSWSPPKTPAERRLLQLRLEQLKSFQEKNRHES